MMVPAPPTEAVGSAPGTSGTLHPLRTFTPRNERRILLVFPRFRYSFGTFNHAFPLMNVKGFMPPQGLLLIASLLPSSWEIRFVDENIQPATEEDFSWADVVMTSGMHIQRANIHDIVDRAHQANRPVVLGGPSVSSAPEYYPDVDILHLGEAGDGTLRLFELVDEGVSRVTTQQTFQNADRLPLEQFPTPAYHRLDMMEYLLGSVQFSSGCPFTCEFCDIPALYGRNPRLKTPQQIIRELDEMADRGVVSVYFVDDNFIGNPKAAQELLPELIAWQKRRDYQVRLSCEATLNIAKYPRILEQMREAFFTNIFIGIETPEEIALKAMKKKQNLRSPLLEAIATINRHGMEVASGIIMGLDTDTPQTPQAIKAFATASNIPIMTVNILYALPKTALYRRLEEEGRLLTEEASADRDSNIDFLVPYEQVVAHWREVIADVYSPEKLYDRYAYNAEHTFPNRLGPRHPIRQATWQNLKRAAGILGRIVWHVGLRSNYRGTFWRMAFREMCRGQVETMFQVAMVAHHLITYARECVEGRLQASNYSIRDVEPTRPIPAVVKEKTREDEAIPA